MGLLSPSQQQQQQLPSNYYQQQPQHLLYPPPAPGGYAKRAQNPGTIRWNANGVSTSAERRLPFVHRFRPVTGGNPPFRAMATPELNPVGALQERFQSRGLAPEYRVVETGGAPHCPVFTFEVSMGDMVARGGGETKKRAKQAAAKAMLDLIDGKPVNGNDILAQKEPALHQTQGTQGNQVGMLQEHCVTRGLPMPVYEVANVDGQPHQRTFVMNVKVGTLRASGEGMSKKESKREAAFNMCKQLKGIKKVDVVEAKIETLTSEHSKAIQSFYANLEGKKGSVLYELHRVAIKKHEGNFVKILEDLGQEQNFTVTYVDIEECSEEGQVQCLVQLSTMPVAICYGLGPTVQAANSSAAKSALYYLKLMTKKNFAGAILQEPANDKAAASSQKT